MATEQEKLKELFQRERGTEGRLERKEGGDSGAVGPVRQEKLKKIFRHFDADGDGRLDRDDMAALIQAVNPRISFTGQQTDVIVDAVFRTYCDLLGRDDQHVTVDGLLRTCGDGTADLDRDFDTLGLSLDDHSYTPPDATASSTASCVSPTSLSPPPPLPPSQGMVAGELDGQNGEGAVSPGAEGDGASPRHSVTGEPPSSPASSPPSPFFCSKAKHSELDCRDHLPSSSELEQNGDGPSPCPSVAGERRPSLASSSSSSETEDSECDYRSDRLLQSEIEEIPSCRWVSPSDDTCSRGLMGGGQRKVVLRLDLPDNKAKQKAKKIVSGLGSIHSISIDITQKKMTVIGVVDPHHLMRSLRRFWPTFLIYVSG